MPANPHYWVMKKNAMQFVYAAFFPDGEEVFVKFGQSGAPFRRVKQVAQNSPFVLERAVYACAGSAELALKIEKMIAARLQGYRTRGEWFRFARSEGRVFSATIKTVFAAATGRQLSWSEINMDELREEARKGYELRTGVKLQKVA